MTVRYLTTESLSLLDKLLPQIEQTATHRIVNYLSFYSSYTGQHLYHSPNLRPLPHLVSLFASRPTSSPSHHNHIMTKALLSSFFHHHVLDTKMTHRLLNDLRTLHAISKPVLPQLERISPASSSKDSPESKKEELKQSKGNCLRV